MTVGTGTEKVAVERRSERANPGHLGLTCSRLNFCELGWQLDLTTFGSRTREVLALPETCQSGVQASRFG